MLKIFNTFDKQLNDKMQTDLTIIINRNNLTYIGEGYVTATQSSNKINDDGRIITEHFIDNEEYRLDNVTVLDAEENEVYEGKPMKRQYELFEKVYREHEVNWELDEQTIEI